MVKEEIINDDYIINKFYIKDNRCGLRICGKFIKNINSDEYNYLINRFYDCKSIKESIQRIYYHIEEKNKCPICGKPVLWIGKQKRLMLKTCSLQCGYKLRQIENEQYWLNKSGVNNVFATKDTILKIKSTKLKKYGDENYNNSEQTKKTCLKKYGTINGGACKQSLEKIKKTCLEKYGETTPFKLSFVKEKIKKTCLEKYGYETPSKSKIVQEKIKKTCLKKYGVEYYFHLNRGKKYSKTRKKQISQIVSSKEFQEKRFNTMKKNNSFIKSNFEENIYLELLIYFDKEDIIRQYKSDLYPWRCDFYIKSKDIYIEVQGSHFHHFKPFDKTNQNDLNELKRLIEKRNEHPQYNSIIKTWTISDVIKRNRALKNNLNYIEIFPKDNYKIIIKKLVNEKNN